MAKPDKQEVVEQFSYYLGKGYSLHELKECLQLAELRRGSEVAKPPQAP